MGRLLARAELGNILVIQWSIAVWNIRCWRGPGYAEHPEFQYSEHRAVFKGNETQSQVPKKVKITNMRQQLIFINMSLYTASVTAAKISILLFYRRIFWVHESFVRATTIIGVISVCWFIVVEATIFSTCQPINAAWDLGINAKCIDFMTFFLGMAIVELLIDVCILCLPIWHVLNLKLELKYKIGVLFIFLLGGFVCITSILRIQKVYVPGERQRKS